MNSNNISFRYSFAAYMTSSIAVDISTQTSSVTCVPTDIEGIKWSVFVILKLVIIINYTMNNIFLATYELMLNNNEAFTWSLQIHCRTFCRITSFRLRVWRGAKMDSPNRFRFSKWPPTRKRPPGRVLAFQSTLFSYPLGEKHRPTGPACRRLCWNHIYV